MFDNPFDSPNLLLNRARENRDELNIRAKAFFDNHPYAYVVDKDPDTGRYLHKIKFTSAPPGELFPIAADAINNLRSALDQGIGASVRTLKPDATLRGLQFVFGDSQSQFEKTLAGVPSIVHKRAKDVMGFFQPYKGGNSKLWVLNKLAQSNKHRSLIGFGADVSDLEFNRLILPEGSLIRPRWDRAKNEIEMVSTPTEAKIGHDLNVSFYIAFGDIEGAAGEPVVKLIDYLAAIVESFLVGMESDFKQIRDGKIPR